MTARIRLRGIYTTALTRLLLDAGYEVVDASDPIRRRFEADFPDVPPDVTVSTSTDRTGVGLSGDPEATASVLDHLCDVGVDALSWHDPAPPGAVFDGTVTETLGGGAVVALAVDEDGRDVPGGGDSVEGYLPYNAVDAHVETGDPVRLQVRESSPPWADSRPTLDGDLRVTGGLVTLEPGSGTRVDGRTDAAARELAGMVDLLGLEPPSGWRAVWSRAAVDADGDALAAALEAATERAERFAADIGELGVRAGSDPAEDGPLASPHVGAWVWFGRECRFELDSARRRVTTTLPGHHRIKAGSSDASAGVDLAEALCEPSPDAEFPFEAVVGAFGPSEGDALRIEHGKPDGRLIVLGEGEVTAVEPDGSVTVERSMTGGGTYDGLDVPRDAGDVAVTSLKEGRWWYPTTYRGTDGTVKGTYVNVCTPVELFPDGARYVDLHVDVIKHADGTVERVDDEILDASVADGNTPETLAEKARAVASALEGAL
ncbi:DUF402 domain-containing protein [Halorubrum vacuolatum]|uniref:Probable ribonuclease FAU-1 n=1 Tax=Halorubrum vacuolatum TaxID=63740 RepID=A0A238XKI9_HALVU|nr:DUF402 domain-containing protein [Halorubrum vacuolatum]SNR59536.1 RNA-binding protein AU-1 [Halorubrum vacuolatum]